MTRKDCGVNIDPNKQDIAPGAPLRKRKSKKGRNITIATICVLLIGACAWGVLAPKDKGGWIQGLWAKPDGLDDSKWHEVKRGPLTISLRRSGTIHHRNKVIINSKLEGSSTVIWLIEEGAQVKAGALLLEMDPTNFVQKKEAQDIVVIRSEALLVSETENLVVAKNTAKTEIDDAKLAIMLAELALKKYLGGDLKDYSKEDPKADDEGEYAQLFQEAEAAISIAVENRTRAEDRLVASETLAEAGYLTGTELKADKLALKQAKINVKTAESKLQVLKKYTYVSKSAELRNGLLKAQRALKPIERKAAASIRQAEADVTATTSEHKRHLDLQKKYGDQIKECKIYAPVDGQVVYATTTSRRHRERSEELKKGASVRERQELFHMPNEDQKMMAIVKIPQACEPMLTDPKDASLLKLPAKVTIAGAKNKYFPATLAEIDPLPYHDWIQSIKIFNAEVHLDDVSPDLRPGYSCKVEIVVAQYDDVVSVPIQSVQLVRDKPTVYVKTGAGYEPRVVDMGMDNNRFVHIKSGLKAGEHVLLAPPFDETTADPSGKGPKIRKPNRAATRPATRPAGGHRTRGANSGSDRGRGSGRGRPKR